MKKKIVVSSLLVVLTTVVVVEMSNSFSSAPPAARTNAPGEPTCAVSGCHNTFGVNSGTGNVRIIPTSPMPLYSRDSVYEFTVSVSDVAVLFGFQATMLDANDQKAGNIMVIPGESTGISNQGGRQYISHRNASAKSSWKFNWQAPSADVGPITFYAVGNAADGNGGDSNDRIYSTTFTLEHNPADTTKTFIGNQFEGVKVRVYPNPTTSFVSVQSEGRVIEYVDLMDMSGKRIHRTVGATIINMNEMGIEKGMYLLHVKTDKGMGIAKISYN